MFLSYSVESPKQVCFKDSCFSVELARTPEQRRRGLMYREHLDPGKGMLFIHEQEGHYAFWMKNTLISLDIIWINQERKVVFIKENVPPCPEGEDCDLINSDKPAKYVLELKGGTVQEINLKAGDKATFR